MGLHHKHEKTHSTSKMKTLAVIFISLTVLSSSLAFVIKNDPFVPILRKVRNDDVTSESSPIIEENPVTEQAEEKAPTTEGSKELLDMNLDLDVAGNLNDLSDNLNFGSFCKFLFYCGLISLICVLLMNLKVCDKIPHCKK